MRTTLNREQSEKLIALGIDKNKASIKADREGPELFTLTDLLQSLPAYIYYRGWHHWLEINHFDGGWNVNYSTTDNRIGEKFHEELIEALYELLIWVLRMKNTRLKILKWYKDEYIGPGAVSPHFKHALEESSRKALTGLFINALENENYELIEKHKDVFNRIVNGAREAWRRKEN